MSSLFRSLHQSFGGRDFDVRKSLIEKLKQCLKDLQVEQADPDSKEGDTSEAVSDLCTVLEAIFIHGLKETFLQRVSKAMISEFDTRPNPNFWGPLMEVSHRDVIDEVMKLNLVMTDVGRCRAWLRLALNEGVLCGYLIAMGTEGQHALSHYYRKGALLRDVELLGVVQALLQGVESYPFNLPFNSSLLDIWTPEPLLQAGLWTPPIRPPTKDHVAFGTDLAQKLEKEDEERSSDTVSVASVASHHSFGFNPTLLLNEEEALKFILGTPVNDAPIAERSKSEEGKTETNTDRDQPEETVSQVEPLPEYETKANSKNESISTVEDSKSKDFTEEDDNVSALGNSIIKRPTWSSSFEESMSDSGTHQREDSDEKQSRKEHLKKRFSSRQDSYHEVLSKYYNASSSSIQLPDINDFLSKYQPSNQESPSDSTNQQPDEFGSLLLYVTKLPRELGLDAQRYSCFGCVQPVGFNFGAVRLCGLSGRYFCDECSGEEWVVPARILFNWDFRRYNVSKQAAKFLTEIQYHPILDLRILNPILYTTVGEVSKLQRLRVELNLLRAFLNTCREPVIDELQKMVWPRDYLYEHIHLYSIADLLQIPNGALAQQLEQVASFARKHVYGCCLCSQKGFFCEKCQNPKIIYPFDTATTYQCSGCHAVFHKACLNAKQPCPKCERRKKREESSTTDLELDT